jgi:hypothetical protein
MNGKRRLAVAVTGLLAMAVVPGRVALAQPPPAVITLSVTPACSPGLTAFAIAVEGESFNPFTAVLVTFDAAAGGRPESFDRNPDGSLLTTDGFGTFQVVIHPTLRPEGGYLVRADDFREGEATATGTIRCTPPVTPPPPPVFHPQLAFHPAVTRRGFIVKLTGTGFPPNAAVHLDWGDLRGRSVVPTISADKDGAFTVAKFLVFEETRFGTDRVQATPASGSAFAAVNARLLVVPGTVQPPSFKVRS